MQLLLKYPHESDDVQGVQHGHHPGPPTVLMYGTVEAPPPDRPRRPLLRPFRRSLPFDQLLEVNPLTLGLCEQSGARPGSEVADDDTIHGSQNE